MASGMSPISSRNSVEPWAASSLPTRSPVAPVNAPRRCPNSSASSRPAGTAAQWTAIIGRSRRPLAACSARAATSLPAPVGPTISTDRSVGATRATTVAHATIAGASPISSAAGAGRRPRRSWATNGIAIDAITSTSWARRGPSGRAGSTRPRYSAPSTRCPSTIGAANTEPSPSATTEVTWW